MPTAQELLAPELLAILRCSQCKGALRLTDLRSEPLTAAEPLSAPPAVAQSPTASSAETVSAAPSVRPSVFEPGRGALPALVARAALDCPVCRLRFPIRDGIPIMLIDDAIPW